MKEHPCCNVLPTVGVFVIWLVKLAFTWQGAWFVLLKYPAYCDSLSLCNGVAEIHGMTSSCMAHVGCHRECTSAILHALR